jgi:hypothetical protein
MTPEERAAHIAKLKAEGRTTTAIGFAGAAGPGFLVFGPVGLVTAPAALYALMLAMANR